MSERPSESTTFKQWLDIKTKAKIYIAEHNRKINGTKEKKITLGILINRALDYYLKDVKFDG